VVESEVRAEGIPSSGSNLESGANLTKSDGGNLTKSDGDLTKSDGGDLTKSDGDLTESGGDLTKSGGDLTKSDAGGLADVGCPSFRVVDLVAARWIRIACD
jgi:hypothetical protein